MAVIVKDVPEFLLDGVTREDWDEGGYCAVVTLGLAFFTVRFVSVCVKYFGHAASEDSCGVGDWGGFGGLIWGEVVCNGVLGAGSRPGRHWFSFDRRRMGGGAFALEGWEDVGRLEGEEVRGCWCGADAGWEREPTGVVDGEFFPRAEGAKGADAKCKFCKGKGDDATVGFEAVVDVREVARSVYEKVWVIGDGAKS